MHGGTTPAERWSVTLADGRRVFAKLGTDGALSGMTASWARVVEG